MTGRMKQQSATELERAESERYLQAIKKQKKWYEPRNPTKEWARMISEEFKSDVKKPF